MITHQDCEIDIGLAQETLDGRFTVEWAVYRAPRNQNGYPVFRGTTIALGDPELAEAMAHADSRNAVNGLG